jgi:hypothetical protein
MLRSLRGRQSGSRKISPCFGYYKVVEADKGQEISVAQPKLSKLELQILEALWAQGKGCIREIQEAFPEPRPAYNLAPVAPSRRQHQRSALDEQGQFRDERPRPFVFSRNGARRPQRARPIVIKHGTDTMVESGLYF